MDCQIGPFESRDWDELWPMLHEVFSRGETYAYPRDMSEPEAKAAWCGVDRYCFVARCDSQICGSYIIKKNQPGQGSHVCNGSYVVGKNARGRGLGRLLCLHSLDTARDLGFKAMQFNLVVSNNSPAIHLWESCGFSTVGRLPKAFKHPRLGFIDAFVMYQWLISD